MGYTKELEEWVLREACETQYAEIMIADQSAEAHFWLSAFAKLVREEAAVKGVDNPYLLKEARIGAAFNALCERFGLESANERLARH